jgi:CheY-like chemotaxis protein
MPQGGRLTLRTARSPAPDPGGPDRPVQLEVIDSGCGMPAEVVERAFEPFFTTKGPGGGTGLGLSTVYGAVTEAGGEIAILSTPGSGTTIRIRLPAAPSAAASGPQTPVARPATDHADARGHGETILLTEDEDDLRELLHRTLSDAGYRVIDHASPAEALKTAADQTLPLDALVTDVIMPGMSGPQLAERIRHDRPVLPVLFMSGYTAGSLPSSTPLPPGAPLIRKPFTRRALLDRLRVLLDEA